MKKKTKNKLKKKWKAVRKKIYKTICGIIATILCVSCGTTKAVVTQPKNSSYTQITITTNNPIQTEVKPNTHATLWDKK